MEQREASQPPVDAFLVEVDENGGEEEDHNDDYDVNNEAGLIMIEQREGSQSTSYRCLPC